MEQILASLIDGLLLGFVYGLAAMGLTLIFGVMDVINLAHGPIIALGMFGLFFFSGASGLGLHPYIAVLLVAVLGLGFGFVMYFVAVHRILDVGQSFAGIRTQLKFHPYLSEVFPAD